MAFHSGLRQIEVEKFHSTGRTLGKLINSWSDVRTHAVLLFADWEFPCRARALGSSLSHFITLTVAAVVQSVGACSHEEPNLSGGHCRKNLQKLD